MLDDHFSLFSFLKIFPFMFLPFNPLTSVMRAKYRVIENQEVVIELLSTG